MIIAGLIAAGMNLGPDVVAVYNQRRRIPPTSGLFIDVAIIATKTYGNNTRTIAPTATTDLVEIQGINVQEMYQIDIFSADASARVRRYELLAALSGIASQQAQEKYSFQIAHIPSSFVDVSEIEASARLNRYALTITVLAFEEIRRTTVPFTIFSIPPQILVNQ